MEKKLYWGGFTKGQLATMLLAVLVAFIVTYLNTGKYSMATIMAFAFMALCVMTIIGLDAYRTYKTAEVMARRIEERQHSRRQRPRHRPRTSSRRG